MPSRSGRSTKRRHHLAARAHGHPSGALRRVPDLKLYQLDANGVLRRQGERVPFATLPEMKWSALTDFWELELPPTVFSANPPDPCEIRLEASDTVSNPSALVTEPSFLLALADDAPAIRLAAFCFAATNTKKVVLIGDTLPPIPGDRYVLHRNALCALRLDLDPPTSPRPSSGMASGPMKWYFSPQK